MTAGQYAEYLALHTDALKAIRNAAHAVSETAQAAGNLNLSRARMEYGSAIGALYTAEASVTRAENWNTLPPATPAEEESTQ